MKRDDSLELYYEPEAHRDVEGLYSFPVNHGPIHHFGATGRIATGTWDGFVLDDVNSDGRVFGVGEVVLEAFGGSCAGVLGVGIVQTADRFIWVENCGNGLVQATAIDEPPGSAPPQIVLTALPGELVRPDDVKRLVGPPAL